MNGEIAEAERCAELPWVKQLVKKLTVSEEIHSEINRFCQKFSLTPKNLQMQNISDKPYVRLTATVPINVANMERKLKISNRIYGDVGEDVGEWKSPKFSDFAHEVAKGLAEIFNGKIVVVYNYKYGEAWLNVVTENDTIEVENCVLEREDC